jgi:L-fuculose-phosphate aldolase
MITRKDPLSADLDVLRADILSGFRILDAEGQNSGIAGHVTARSSKTEALLAHSYGLAFDEVTDSEIHETTFDLECKSGGKVSPSLAFHVAIYRKNPKIQAVVHTHGRHAIAIGAAGAHFRPVFQSALMLWDRVSSYDQYDGIVESEEVGRKMADAIGENQILALRNHGIIAVGETIREAVCAAVIYEDNCAMQLKAMATGKVVDLNCKNPQEAREFLSSQKVIDLRWQQLARKAQRKRYHQEPFETVPDDFDVLLRQTGLTTNEGEQAELKSAYNRLTHLYGYLDPQTVDQPDIQTLGVFDPTRRI